jgi:putative transposase
VFHVLNRGVGRMELFSKEKFYAAFEGLLEETCESWPMRICAHCLMPNHWQLVLWPAHDRDLTAFMKQLTTKHMRRWQLHREKVGYGHGYQGRYKSFPVEEEDDFYQRVRYVERNALRAGLVERAEAWRWCSLWRRTSGTPEQKQLLSDWPVAYPKGWCKLVKRTANRGRVGGDSPLRGPAFGPALRRRAVGPPNGGTTGTGINAASTTPAEKIRGCPPARAAEPRPVRASAPSERQV